MIIGNVYFDSLKDYADVVLKEESFDPEVPQIYLSVPVEFNGSIHHVDLCIWVNNRRAIETLQKSLSLVEQHYDKADSEYEKDMEKEYGNG